MLLSTRPDWTRATKGAPIDTVVRVYNGSNGARKDIITTRNTVAIVRVAASAKANPDDEYQVGYVYGPEATNQDITQRSLKPLIKKFVEGYNTTIVCFGATGGGKTFTLEGGRSRDASHSSSDGDGAVHWAIDEVFKQLHQRAVAVGDQIAQKRRMPSAKAFEFFLETSFVEVYNEGVRDLYQRGAAANARLPVFEDDLEGYQVSGLSYRHAKSEAEMRSAFNGGRTNRDTSTTDLGRVHDRAAAIFTLHLAQYAPAAVPGEEDRVMVSRMQFVDMPGAERLASDVELLRLREGEQLNRGLFAWAAGVRDLAESAAAGGVPLAGTVNLESSVLTKLLADALGGNALVLMLGCCRCGDWVQTKNCLQHIATAQRARTFPVVNHGRVRGLLLLLRRRLLGLVAQVDTYRDQLQDTATEGDPNAVAISIARVRDLQARLQLEREEKASLLEEKQALQARLLKLREAGTSDLEERGTLQQALIKSEEMRINLAKELIRAQMDFNDEQMRWSEEKLELEKRLLELEGSHFERYVRAEDHAALEQERDSLNARLLAVQEEVGRKQQHIQELNEEIDELKAKLRKAEHELNMLGDGGAGNAAGNSAWDLPPPEDEALGDDPGTSLEAKRRQLFMQLRNKDRRIAELQSEMKDMSQELDRLRNAKYLTQTGVDEIREAYRRKLEMLMRDVSDLARAVAIMQEDPSTALRVRPEDLFNTFQKLTDENLRVTEGRERELRQDLDGLHNRHGQLKAKFKSLFMAYRQMRYLVADRWPGGHAALDVANEEHVIGAAVEDVLSNEEESDRRLIARLRDQASKLGLQLGSLRIAEEAAAKGVAMKPSNLSMPTRENTFESSKFVELPDMVSLENQKMREELDRLRKQMGNTPVDKLRQDNRILQAQLTELGSDKTRSDLAKELATTKLDMDRLKQQLATQIASPGHGSAVITDARTVTKQIQAFQDNTQAELERRIQAAEAAKLMAEEQLSSLQTYMTQATLQYQREIVRLRGIIGQMDPGGGLIKANPLRGK